jgi:MFS family permease
MSVTADRIRGRSRVHREDTRGPVSDLAVVRERQRDEYGGTNWGAAFFGWLVAVGLGALLTAFVSAAGAAIAFSEFESLGDASSETETIGLVGGIALLAVAAIAYFAGGYVAGRMSRFDGRRQGLAVWIWGIVAIVVLAILGAIAGEEYNLFAALELPRIPIDEGDVTTGGVIALILIAIGTLLAAIAGGSAGEAYHRRVDRAGWDETRLRERDEKRREEREADRDRRPQRA